MPPRAPVVNNRQKAAVLLVAMGPQASGHILKQLTHDEVETLTLEIARMGRVSPEFRETIIEEFHSLCLAQEFMAEGGVDAAKEVLEAAFGPEQAHSIVGRVLQTMQVMPFDFVKHADASQVITFIQNEHPQTIALILAYLPASQAANIIS